MGITKHSKVTIKTSRNMKLFQLFLSFSIASCAHGFLLAPIKTRVSTRTTKDFIEVVSKPDPDFSVYVLPGTLVPPGSYESVCNQIGSLCNNKNITADVSIAKFTLNSGHRFEADSISEKIKKNSKTGNIVIVGHSASAVVGAEIAKNVDASGFVQWCGTFNSNGDFPWDSVDSFDYDMPIMSILSEQDRLFSFPTALREYCNCGNHTSRIFPTSIKDAGHFSGVYPEIRDLEDLPKRLLNTVESTGTSIDDAFDMSVVAVAWRVSEFIGYLNGSPKSERRMYSMVTDFKTRFSELSNHLSIDNVSEMIYGDDTKNNHVHMDQPPGLLYSLVYAAFPEIRPLVKFSTVVLPFIFSYPSDKKSISVSSIMNPFPGAKFNNPSIWAKIPYNGPSGFSKEVNSDTFEKALSEVSDEDREAYFNYGKPLVFESDTEIPLVPGCGLVWVARPLSVNDGGDFVSVSSPVIRMGKTLNTKLISKRQCLEWILVKCFE